MAERILVTGVAGQLGYDVVRELNKRGIENKGVDISDFDLTCDDAVMDYIKDYSPTGIIHCAAYTAVDKAEDEYEKAYAVNTLGTSNIAKAAKETGAKLIYISTDYVFNGEKEGFYNANDEKDPIGAYGRTKYFGEVECRKYVDRLFIVRLSWAFGINGGNFIKTMLKLSETRDVLGVVCDQTGSPTYTKDAAVLLCDMIQSEEYGEYNIANEGYCSWYEFAKAIFDAVGKKITVNPLKTEEYPTKAKRPHNSCFSKNEIEQHGFSRLPHWKDALERYIAELGI